MVNNNHEHDTDTIEPGGFGTSLLAGLLSGGLAGATAMLLLAPQSGKKTRGKLQRQSHELRKQAIETVEDAVEQASVEARKITHDVRKQTAETMDDAMAQARAKVGEVTHDVRKQTAETMDDAIAQARAKVGEVTHDVRKQTAETMDDAMAQARVKVGEVTHDVRKQAAQTMNDVVAQTRGEARPPKRNILKQAAGLLTGLLTGGLMGAGVMLLLAPQSGKKTRAKLERQSHELREQAAETVEDAVAQAGVEARKITHDVRRQAEKLEHRVR